MNKKVTAAIVATGNEVVAGQIVNTNASTLANDLTSDGFNVEMHCSVLDRKEDLENALEYIKSKKIDHVFLIGGLGPTQDDLTRDVVAEFVKCSMEFNDETWAAVEKLLRSRSVVVRETHKRQCYFPTAADILKNDVGTAQGFKVSKNNFSIWCLPGPPSECVSVYQNGIKPWAQKNIKAHTHLKTWQCTNVPESELSYAVENALENCDYGLGFRASPPIVEVKLWVPVEEMENTQAQKWLDLIEQIVNPCLYSRQGQNYFKEVLDFLIKKGRLDFIDSYSKGYLFNEILKVYKNELPDSIHFSTKAAEFKSEQQLSLEIEEENLNLEIKSLDLNFIVSLGFDLEKSFKSKRYRMTLCAELIKELHKKIFQPKV
jgi:molybdenum cofactor synthesis domain-containing protein